MQIRDAVEIHAQIPLAGGCYVRHRCRMVFYSDLVGPLPCHEQDGYPTHSSQDAYYAPIPAASSRRNGNERHCHCR